MICAIAVKYTLMVSEVESEIGECLPFLFPVLLHRQPLD